jgi:hypothetical protein
VSQYDRIQFSIAPQNNAAAKTSDQSGAANLSIQVVDETAIVQLSQVMRIPHDQRV